ncbi:MAG TPA: acetylxylan esterase [Pyrinomonadaceae bacterium]|jgi:cephalosporin-C deacetylase-like acetyl esterase
MVRNLIFKHKAFVSFLLLIISYAAQAQESTGVYQIRVALDRDDWTYQLNQPAKFKVAVTLNNRQVAGLPITYNCGPEAMKPTIVKTVTTSADSLTIEAGSLKEPGFLRCIVTMEKDGRSYRGLATAGYRPDLIVPTTTDPADFDKFWADAKAELAKLPVDAKLELLPSYSTPTVDVYHVSFQNVGGGTSKSSRIYGILAIPKSANPNQKFPAVLSVPGAGVRPYRGSLTLAEKGFITLQIGIHGIPVTLDQTVYDNLAAGALNRYMVAGLENKNEYYYRRVILGSLRANDFLTSLPQFDGVNLGVMGGSQGGALSIMTAALDARVKGLAVWVPALADLTGYIYGRAGGWHHAFKDERNRTPEKIETSKYYDTVNFARRLKVPGIYTFGYNDETCPPTSMFAAYNVIKAPKTLVLALETGHSLTNEQSDRVNKWMETALKGSF